MRLNREHSLKKTKIEIIPMIDTMFFLLVFFILASLNIVDIKGASVDLPDSKNQDHQAPSRLTVTIRQNGEVTVNKTVTVAQDEPLGPVLLRTLNRVVVTEGGTVVNPEEATIVINADRRATAAMVRRCMDEARLSNFKKFSIATEPRSYVEQ